ncbi:MAG: radical SAM protein [Pirellulaceae bacterium]
MQRIVVQATLTRSEMMCHHWGLDLTVGCEHGCAYCAFHKYQSVTLRHAHDGRSPARRLAVDAFLRQKEYPSEIYLSPHTDPLAPAARDNLARVLRRTLPLGVGVGISTKGIVPEAVFRLIAEYREQVVLFVGLTSLDEDRNGVVEPGCPPAPARLGNIRLAREHGLTQISVRLDPLLPGVDDAPDRLLPLLDEVAQAGARQVSAAYLFLLLRSSRTRLQQTPYLGSAAAHCTEVGSVAGVAICSPPLKRKQQTYTWLQDECTARGLEFATCGCKDPRLTNGPFATCCSHPFTAPHSASRHGHPPEALVNLTERRRSRWRKPR